MAELGFDSRQSGSRVHVLNPLSLLPLFNSLCLIPLIRYNLIMGPAEPPVNQGMKAFEDLLDVPIILCLE